MKYRRFLPWFFLAAVSVGCSKSPSGTAGNPLAPNRLQITMRLQQPVNNAYKYAFAFDDDDISADGPQAIVGTAAVPNNGLVAGSFTVLVIYENGQYSVFRRTELGNGNETLDRASRAFVTPPQPVFGDTFNFTLDLDAVTDSGVRLFRADARRLDVNFVTANERRRVDNTAPRIAFDAFGGRSASAYGTFQILGASRYEYRNADTVREPTNDVQTDDTSGNILLPPLDITDFSISVLRNS
jgi:hypothetical protein